MAIGPDGIRRFPRLATKDNRTRFLGLDVSNGRIPRGYNKITKRQKKLLRLMIGGMPLHDALKKLGINSNTHYRHWHYNKAYQQYYYSYAQQQAQHYGNRLDAKTGRAIAIIEESMDNPDPYFKADVATEFLKGRGLYKRNVEGKQLITGAVVHGVTGNVKHDFKMDKEMMQIFVDGLVGMARGQTKVNAESHDPKIIDVKVVKELPEPKNDLESKIPQRAEKETVRRHQSSEGT
jgi:hypothetical protein